MSPSELKKLTISELRTLFLKMTSPEWDLSLEDKSDEEIAEAGKALLSVQRARLRLGNAQLADIRGKLKENETDIIKGKCSIDEALGNLQDVQKVLETTSAFLQIVGRIIVLAA